MRPASTPTVAKTPTSATTCKPLGTPSRRIVRTSARIEAPPRRHPAGVSMRATAGATAATIAADASVEAIPEPATPSPTR